MTANISNTDLDHEKIRPSCVRKCFARLRLAEAGIYPGRDWLCFQCSCTADAKHIWFECQKCAIERQRFMNKMSSVWTIKSNVTKAETKMYFMCKIVRSVMKYVNMWNVYVKCMHYCNVLWLEFISLHVTLCIHNLYGFVLTLWQLIRKLSFLPCFLPYDNGIQNASQKWENMASYKKKSFEANIENRFPG